MKKLLLLSAMVALAAGSGMAQGGAQGRQTAQGGGRGRGGQNQNQNRDPNQTPQPAGTASISGRVTTADTGRGAKHAQVFVSGNGRGGHSVVTDEQGRYIVTSLSAGTYTVTATKNGFVDAVFGQRRPLQPGTPVQLADAQQLTNIDMRIVRGGVITGRVSDEDGEPLTRAMVTVQRYQYLRGERTLTAAGADQTDDRGMYRVFGLAPGDYFVTATATGVGGSGGRGLQQIAAVLAGGRGRGGLGATPEPEANGYAPTYYPGVASTAEAGKLTVAPGQEVTGIDFQIQLVPFATISGIVAGADGPTPVTLVPEASAVGGRLGGQTFIGRMLPDASFQITNVPPGRYTAIARSGGGRQGDPKVAVQNVVVNGQNIQGLTLMLQSGVTMSGNIIAESSGTPTPTDYSTFRVDAPEVSPLPGGFGPFGGGRGGGTGGRAQANGTFQIPNLMPGQHYVTIAGQAQGGTWYLKSVLANGQDISDSSVDLKPGQNLDGVTIVLTDRITDLSGTVRDSGGNPAAAVTVIAFPVDPQYWRAQSRRIQSARSDQTGAYHVRGLPPGDYLLAAVDDAQNGEWFDPSYLDQLKASATRVTLGEGDKKTLDLTGPSS